VRAGCLLSRFGALATLGTVGHAATARWANPDPDRSESVVRLPLPAHGDAELLEGLLETRPAAVAALYDRFGDHVYWVLVRTLGSTRDIEDLVQDTFIIVVARCSSIYEPSALRPFVVSVAIRVARNEMRKRTVRRWIGLDEGASLPVASAHDPVVCQALRHAYRALEKLSADCRIAFVLRHVEGYSLVEAAALCGCSLATFKRRLRRADQRFEALAERDPVLREFTRAGRSEEP